MAKFIKKPFKVEAIQWAGLSDDIAANIEYMMEIEEWILQRLKDDRSAKFVGDTIEIETLDGTATTNPGEWIICDELGELRPCSPVVFNATYEPA